MFCNNRQVETPYAIPRLDDVRDYLISAYARLQTDDGCFYSNIVELMVQVPAHEEEPQPGPYPPNWPYIVVTEGDEYYTVEGLNQFDDDNVTVYLYCDDVLVDNPYIVERTYEDMVYTFTAVAHLDGCQDSYAVITLLVPALEEEPQPGPYPPHWPYFQVTEGDRNYTVTAHCNDEGSEYVSVRLYCDGILVDNPYIIERTHEDIEYVFEAWAHCDGYEDLSAEMAIIVSALEEPVSGDMNGDKEVGIADVNTLINAILSSNGEEKYDLNGDGEVTVADVMALINLIIWAN